MPRISREQMESKYVHLITQGIKKEYIFRKEKYKEKYFYLIKNILGEYNNMELLSHCIMDNHMHMIIYCDAVHDMTEAFRRINTAYAIYYNKQENRVGYVFRNRYYTQQITNKMQLYNTMVYVHRNPVKAGIVAKMEDYEMSSYNLYAMGKIENKIAKLIFETEDYAEIFNFIHRTFDGNGILEVEEVNSKKDIKIQECIEEFCERKNLRADIIKKDNSLLMELVEYIKENTNAMQKEIGQALGIGKNRIGNIKNSRN